jgi:hypothetical protein
MKTSLNSQRKDENKHTPDENSSIYSTVHYEDLLAFTRKYLFCKTNYTLLYCLVLVLTLFVSIRYAAFATDIALNQIFTYFTVSLLLLIPLTLVHEMLHIGVYVLFGADWQQISFKLRFSKSYFVVNHFTLSRQQFIIQAIFPVLILTLLGISLLPLFAIKYQIILSGLLFFHTLSGCGDFALVNYLLRHKKIDTITDDANNQEILFSTKLR